MTDILAKLARPFDPDFIHWRVGSTTKDKTKGMPLAYIDARNVMERLDEVVGMHWSCEYPFPGCCKIGIFIGGEWYYRSNGAGETSYEKEKGQYSDAFKRAAVLWGIGRYLYDFPNTWQPINEYKNFTSEAQLDVPIWARPDIWDNMLLIREHIECDQIREAATIWYEDIPKSHWAELSKAPSKGGRMTTYERDVMRNHFRSAYYGDQQ